MANITAEILSITGSRWIKRKAENDKIEVLKSAKINPVVAQVLAARGIESKDQARRLLNTSLNDLHNPYLMHNMDLGVDRLEKAIRGKENVRIITDYDVDGTTSSLILQATLRLRGLKNVSFAIPHRMKEGYGFSVVAAEKAKKDGIQLIVTADIGVKDHEAVTRAKSLGIDVIILDHHLPPDTDVPKDAVAVLCPPQKACSYPNPALAACGVSLKFAQALLAGHPKFDAIFASMLKLAAIGTVADIVDLFTPENRAIVTLGLRELNQGTHSPGLKALLEAASLQKGNITETDLGFRIGPRINAAGRMDSADIIIKLFSERNLQKARKIAKEIDRQNLDRRNIQRRLVRIAEQKVGSDPPAFIVLDGDEEKEGWHRGVVGIVAARIRDKFYRPTALIARSKDGGTASVRSIKEVHAVKTLDMSKDLLTRYGGHPAAAGFSVPLENIEALKTRLNEAALTLVGGKMPIQERSYDAEIEPQKLTKKLLSSLRKIAPFGKGNPSPILMVKNAFFLRIRKVGDGHFFGELAPNCQFVWWNAQKYEDFIRSENPVEILGSLEINEYRGQKTLRLNVRDARRQL